MFSFTGYNSQQNTYHTVAENLKEFQKLKALPMSLKKRCEKYESSSDLSNTFILEKVVFHKSCIALYNKQKLTRKRKMFDKDDDEPSGILVFWYSGILVFC